MILNSPYITGSLTVTGNITASGGITISGSIASSSYATNAERLDNLDSTSFVFTSSYNTDSASVSTRVTKIEGNYATTGSNVFMGAQTVCANITSTGTIIAQTLNVQQVTSSIVYSSGSNIFGNLSTDVQQMTGSLRVTGSTSLNGSVSVGNSASSSFRYQLSFNSWNASNSYPYLTLVTPTGTNLPGVGINTSNDFVIGRTSALNTNFVNEDIKVSNSTGNVTLAGSLTGSTATFSGNVGIGTCSPSYTLDVTGTGRFTGTLSVNPAGAGSITLGANNSYGSISSGGGGATLYLNGSTRGGSTTAAANAVVFGTDGDFFISNALANSHKMFVSGSGNVGIGTTAPNYPLEIATSNGYGFKIATNDGTAANNSGMLFYNEASATAATRRSYILLDPNGGNGIGGDYTFLDMFGSGTATLMNQLTAGTLAFGVGGTAKMYVTGSNSGQVLIGSSTPSGTEKLGVTRDDGVGNGLHIIADFNRSGASSAELILGYYADGASVTGPVVYAANSQPLLLAAGGAERMRITSGGDIRIGPSTTSSQWYFNYNNTNNKGGISINYSTGEYQIWTGESGNGYYQTFYTNGSERMRITCAGYLYVGKCWGDSFHRITRLTSEGGAVLIVSGYDTSSNNSIQVNGASGASANTPATVLWVATNSSTGRSINAGGTINASGADYAEYMTKAIEDNIAKGDIVGVNVDGKLTNIFDDAISFVVKSTDPSYVGGDTWGNEEIIGEKRPTKTTDETEEEFASKLSAFEAKLEEARAKVDRISFSGQIPCNVYSATVGDYIIPIKLEDGKIGGQAVSNPTLEQYKISVGKVWKIMNDGRAWIAVKIG